MPPTWVGNFGGRTLNPSADDRGIWRRTLATYRPLAEDLTARELCSGQHVPRRGHLLDPSSSLDPRFRHRRPVPWS